MSWGGVCSICKPPPFITKKVRGGYTLAMAFLGMFLERLWNWTESSGREEGQGSALEPWPETILEFRRKRLSTSVQPPWLERSNVWLGEELHSRDEKEVIKKKNQKLKVFLNTLIILISAMVREKSKGWF